jgi:hypothetical protein
MMVANLWRTGWRLSLAGLAMMSIASFAQAQLLYSFEGNPEGWNAEGSGAIANSLGGPNAGTGVTHGTDSLEITVGAPDYQVWGNVDIGGQQLTDLVAAADHPLTRRIEFDMTYDYSLMPAPTPETYTWQQMAFNTNFGWSQIDFFVEGVTGNTDITVRHAGLLKNFGTVKQGLTSARIRMASSSSWGAGAGKVFLDNLRITTIVPDLDNDNDIDAADWGIFLSNHQTGGFNGTVPERFLLGDFDADRDNDFNDFLVFEAAFDEANGAGSFQEMLNSVPEPGSMALVACGLTGFALLRRFRRGVAFFIMVSCIGVGLCGTASAQLLHDFEAGVEEFIAANFGAVPASVNPSTVGATMGTGSLQITASEGDLFNWSAQASYGQNTPKYNIIADAVDIGIEHFAFEFDLTYDTGFIPQNFVSFVNTSVAFNSSGGWFQYDGLGTVSGTLNETVHVQIPLDQVANPPNGTGSLVPRNQTGFYQVNIALNNDWGPTPGSVFVDNIRLVQTSIPGTLTLEVNRSNGQMRIKNANAGAFDFGYYTISSAGNSLKCSGWNSLDDQNINAVDGPDPGNVAGDSLLEGWDEAPCTAGRMTEAFLNGQSTLAVNNGFTLGTPYDNITNAEDLVFQYRDMNRPTALTMGVVEYIGVAPGIDADFNNDGSLNCTDIDLLTNAVAMGGTVSQFDLNGDGALTILDVDRWRSDAGAANLGAGRSYRVGDANLDGVVDGSDFGVWNSNKFTSNKDWCKGNFNADVVTDGSDFGLWNSNKFTSSDGTVVPEPISWSLIFTGLGVMMSIRRRR